MFKRQLLLALLTITASFYAVSLVAAQETYPTADDVNLIASKLYCPVCPNTPLDVCETQACADWRAQIHDQLSAGWSEEQVMTFFVEQYGERVLAEPERGGFTALIWILPVIGLALGLYVAIQALRSWRKGSLQTGAPEVVFEPAISPESRARIERELRELV